MDYINVLLIILVLSSAISFSFRVMNKLKSLETRFKSMKYTLDQLAKQAGMPEHPVNNELREYIKEGKEVQAIKRAREVFGFSILEAKKYVDDL